MMITVGCGAAIGAIIRYVITTLFKRLKFDWPLATLLINLSGSLLLGILSHLLIGNPALLTFWGVGVLGGYTTFSTFNTELVSLIDERRWRDCVLYLVLSYGGGCALAFLGMVI